MASSVPAWHCTAQPSAGEATDRDACRYRPRGTCALYSARLAVYRSISSEEATVATEYV